MRNADGKLGFFVITAVVIGLTSVSSLSAAEKSWRDDTVLISPQGDQTVVRPLEGDQTLFKNADPQLAIEWGMANARITVVLAGKYVASDRIDVPRDNVTLIVGQGAEISLNGDTEHTSVTPGFRGRGKLWPHPAVIYVKERSNFRLIHLGKLEGPGPIFFDGRNEKRTCGIQGGLLVSTGTFTQHAVQLNDCKGVQVPLVAVDKALPAVIGMEGSEGCRIGTVIHLSGEPGGKTGETVDLNSSNRDIIVERLIAERPHEIIDMNGSHLDAKEIVLVGEPNKLLCFTVNAGPRWTYRPACPNRLDVWKATILEDYAGVALKNEVPKLPDALPRFTVKATVEVTMKDGSKKEYAKEVEIDVRK